jgi:hypothetical protein
LLSIVINSTSIRVLYNKSSILQIKLDFKLDFTLDFKLLIRKIIKKILMKLFSESLSIESLFEHKHKKSSHFEENNN